MTTPNLRRIGLGLLAATGLLVGCATDKKPVFSDSRITATAIATDDADEGVALQTVLWGKTYRELRGRKPYYTEIPGSQKILFVTPLTAEAGPTVVHIADYATQTVVDIPAPYAKDIGSGIGVEGEGLAPERVVSASDQAIVLEDTYAGGLRRYTIDLRAKTVTGAWIKPPKSAAGL